jgi:disulfide oxidoreductase YuzD
VIKVNEIDKRFSNTNKAYKPLCEKDGRIKDFIKLLKKKDFIVQEGSLQYIDILKLVSEGKSSTALGNIVGAPYATYLLPPAPNQMPSPGQRPPKDYEPDNPNNYPPNLDFIMPGLHYKLRPDEAIVLIGQTPPQSAYFGFISYLALVENKPGKDYRDTVTAGDRRTGFYHFIGASLGDQINNYSIWTGNTPYGTPGKPFDTSTIIITTANKRINEHMRDALKDSGFSPGIMNNDNIPIDLVNMGLEKGKDHFSFVMRANIFEDPDVGWDYIHNIEKYFTVLRITPKKPYTPSHPWPITALKAKEICTNEFQAIPTARNTQDYLRKQILRKYKNPEYDAIDLDFNLAILDNYEGILQDVNVWIDNRDTVYVKTENFKLATDDDFLIVYGVNNTQTGFATFINVSLYGDELWNGVAGTVFTNERQYPADEYFPECDKNSRNYYVVKMARRATEKNDITIPYSTGNPKGSAYGVDNNQKLFLVIRMYTNQKTKVASAPFDIIWGHAILFTKKKRHRPD